jgi:ribonucrease Y
MSVTQYMLMFAGSIIAGYVIFLMILKILPKRLSASHRTQKAEVLAEAKKQADFILNESRSTANAKNQMLLEELTETLADRQEDLKLAEENLNILESQIQPVTARVQKLENELKQLDQHKEFAQTNYLGKQSKFEELQVQVRERLEQACRDDSKALLRSMSDGLVEQRQLESQKLLKLYTEELNSGAKRIAARFLSRSMSRYTPEFPWPKMTNAVEVEDRKVWELLESDSTGLIAAIKELAGIEAEFHHARDVESPAIIKLAGGMGVEREAARLALTEVVKLNHHSAWPKVADYYKKHRELLDQQALKLGRQAIMELRLDDIHTEIQKLIGYLNWRTSYRQNQYLHSFEVAVLAGLVAEELGVDPTDAKRCGLLHDIGKVLDYKIEGSHAVISGDYADRYGESRYICDTVMSHHNDLVLETPLAHVLKTADTLSGARPGARVNLEEGYQDRLRDIDDVIRSFHGITKSAIMNGGREIHIEVNHKRVKEGEIEALTTAIARKLEQDVAFPGQIKVMITRRFESSTVA